MSEPEVASRPKPRFRWPISRQRAIELVVVVFGVMIALGLDNLVQEIRLQGDARDLEQALGDDIHTAVSLSWERQLVAPCLRQNLALMAARVATPGAAAAPTLDHSAGALVFALPQAYRAPRRVWPTSTFDRALGSEAFKRIPRDRAEFYANLFAQIAALREDNAAEFLIIANLAPLTYPQPDLDPEVRADLLQTIAQLDRHQAIALIGSDQIIQKAMNLPGREDIRAKVRNSSSDFEKRTADDRQAYGACIDTTVTDRLMEATKG